MASTETITGTMPTSEAESEGYGVLLYYQYVDVPDDMAAADWMRRICEEQGLLGRVRVSKQGFNVTVAGSTTALHKHISSLSHHPSGWFAQTDFKLEPCDWPPEPRIARECKVDSLSVRVVKELVTLCPVDLSLTGDHLSPAEFHRCMVEGRRGENQGEDWRGSTEQGERAEEDIGEKGGKRECGGGGGDGKVGEEGVQESGGQRGKGAAGGESQGGPVPRGMVVLDTRNVYETRIGRFVPPEGVAFIDPCIRQFSDLPAWVDRHEEELKNKTVLMYCTGGVRCESATAYLRSKGPGFQDVVQLSGGIVRYLEAFPDGGFFRGKNFVFDHRLAVPPAAPQQATIGACCLCEKPFDDYSGRKRCVACRMLLLVCPSCSEPQPHITCEICQKGSCKAEGEGMGAKEGTLKQQSQKPKEHQQEDPQSQRLQQLPQQLSPTPVALVGGV
ncbi:hypothetical protein CLOP_g18329 [Closterium sp. NIES-67]|nr:hypothetical protein CLOP_g18329 [Closterium sp. NIES-67]